MKARVARFSADAFFLQLRVCPLTEAITPLHMTVHGADLTTM